ncbi:MAG: cobyrinic acid a,c-diamide synthase [Thermodesulfovibrio sp.]|nr:cobyrinic acid a,c-diamide synthase [Thermodesulfovibrio sp.]
MQKRYPRIVIAGLRGGSGKTTLSLGLIASLAGRGRKIVPFKKGPDYIDAGWLASAAGRQCYNLDPFLIGSRKILDSFTGHAGGADLAVIEGNRGLYDGMDAAGTYSTAELAKMLGAPVILIMDCTKATRTAAAMVYGMLKFDRRVDIRGVVLNQIAGKRHEAVIREAVEKYCGIPVLGALPKLRTGLLSERHMGLTPFQEHGDVKAAISEVGEIIARYVDIDRIYRIARDAGPIKTAVQESGGKSRDKALQNKVTIGIVRDAAFQFYYPENFEELERHGARLIEISALTEKKLPEIDALYIGGGFPETNAIGLAKNRAFRQCLKKEIEKGLPVYAECGGLMYLGRTLTLAGKQYPMAGILPLDFEMGKKPAAHGYTVVKITAQNLFYRRGTVLRGHEFHYSRLAGSLENRVIDPGIHFAFSLQRGEGILGKKDGICYKNVLATYTHLHAYGSPQWAAGMLRAALSYRKEKEKRVTTRRSHTTA